MGDEGGTIKVWDTATLEFKAEKRNAHVQQYGESIKDVQFSPDGTKIVSCGDHTIKVWDSGVLVPLITSPWLS
eukprot:4677533-Prymnesium_polylepis.1